MPDAAPDPTPDAIPANDFVARFFAVCYELLGGDEVSDTALFVLDPGTSWRATLGSLDAAHASIAARAEHAACFLEVFEDVILNRRRLQDWPGSFRPAVVDVAGWRATRARPFAVTERVAALVRGNPKWPPERVRGGLVNLAHGAQAKRAPIAGYCAVYPPSTRWYEPVTNEASSDAR